MLEWLVTRFEQPSAAPSHFTAIAPARTLICQRLGTLVTSQPKTDLTEHFRALCARSTTHIAHATRYRDRISLCGAPSEYILRSRHAWMFASCKCRALLCTALKCYELRARQGCGSARTSGRRHTGIRCVQRVLSGHDTPWPMAVTVRWTDLHWSRLATPTRATCTECRLPMPHRLLAKLTSHRACLAFGVTLGTLSDEDTTEGPSERVRLMWPCRVRGNSGAEGRRSVCPAARHFGSTIALQPWRPGHSGLHSQTKRPVSSALAFVVLASACRMISAGASESSWMGGALLCHT